MKKSKLESIIEKEVQNALLENEDLDEGVIKNIALATLLGILPPNIVKGQSIDTEKIVNVQQQDNDDPDYPWTPKEEQRKRQRRALDLYKPLVDKLDKIEVTSSTAKENKKWISDLKNGTLISSPTDDDFPEFHFRNPPPLDSSLEEIRDVILNLSIDKLQKLLDINLKRVTPKTAYDIAKITNIPLSDIIRYGKKMKELKDKGHTL